MNIITENEIIVQKNVAEEALKEAAKSTVKDSVFRDLFEIPRYLLQLYQVLHPEDTEVTEEELGKVTITNVLVDQLYNDLGFMVRGKLLVLAEAQSSWSINIIVRILMYLAETWKEHIQSTGQNPYGSKKLRLPEPEFYVIYTGDRKDRTEWYSLSEEFFNGHQTQLEVKVKVLYEGNKGDILSQYIDFTKVYTSQVKLHGRTRKAVMETIQICKDEDILKEYLEAREKEVVDIMTTLFDQRYVLERYGEEKREEGREEGRKEGKEEGRKEGKEEGRKEGKEEGRWIEKKENAFTMHKKGYSDSTIADILGVSVKKIQEWLSGGVTLAR